MVGHVVGPRAPVERLHHPAKVAADQQGATGKFLALLMPGEIVFSW
jgi:hypothetical protein